ncbi:hypothetical protein AcV5_002163 [Taiwanofungus camphoratus]|nr:hypothetical protein AcV5_002163 [Antrodia cinnamomea]
MASSMKPDCCCQSSSDSTTIVMDESKLGQQMLASPELTSDLTQHNVISTKTGYYTNSSVVSPKDIGGSPNVNVRAGLLPHWSPPMGKLRSRTRLYSTGRTSWRLRHKPASRNRFFRRAVHFARDSQQRGHLRQRHPLLLKSQK